MKKQILGTVILIVLILSSLAINSFAAGSFSVTSSRSLNVGETSSITISANECGGKFIISSSDSSVVSISQSSIWVETGSDSVSIVAKGVGTATITVTADNVASTDGETEITGSRYCSVTVSKGGSSGGSTSGGNTTKKPTTNNNTTTKPTEEKKSTDSTLGSLSIAEGAITPEFNKDVKEYAITVPNEVTKLNITATPTDSKATVSVTEYEELKEGENAITITVTAEDGTTKSDYVLKVTRQRKELALQKLVIKYTNQNGEVVEVPLTPEFVSSTHEYSIENLEYWVKALDIEALANIEGATVEIIGADSLKEGENVITITVKNIITVEATEEGTEPAEQEETKTYTIRFNRNEEPTIIGKISNWFKGVFGGISAWYANNQEKAIFGALMLCIAALIGLSIYIIVDYKKYQELLKKIEKLNSLNNNEIKTSVATEKATNIEEKTNNIEDIYKNRKNEIETNIEEAENNQNKEDRPKGGRHF